ncbi:tripartite tricarboxylate transporter substrate binding protein [Siccirubricoccus sp. KC 17139]|uniref:Tripartite tricarboxylate transporter substrate binding protein n=1 Tax=Siccirubricoccus soli TaxID=2899147 RepID=A0ABT1DCB5_9PROT|nr:tripartite tricarboxylate transporter substrate binding protein [Siccirubricoccus soli]MCO6419576.1 tripartite tricarboxylate transporter substrate binding protein [Siccirubricoccus soli]MCP2685711.1 tripartite tricarboxylate transporter substrate binding protein [Siccirubricoccus soli]
MQRRILAAAAAGLLLPRGLRAQALGGGRTMRIIVPYSPGGATDALSRFLAPRLSRLLDLNVVVENRAGGNSIVGTEAALRAAPDGLTLAMIDLAFVVNPAMYASLPYDAQRDAAPVGLVASAAQVLLLHPSVPARNLGELVALAKARPGQLSFGSAGAGTAVRIAGEQFRMAAGIEILHVPYRGGGEAQAAIASGDVSMIFSGEAQAKVMAESGRVRPVAITGPRRGRRMPEVPSFAEAGFPEVDVVTINGLIAPARTPPAVVQQINAAMLQALREPELEQRLLELGFEIVASTPEEFAGWTAQQLPKWEALVRSAGIRPE